MSVNWFRRDTLKDLRKQNIPEGVRVILDDGEKNTREIMQFNEELLPMMILIVDNTKRVKFIFSWNYTSTKRGLDFQDVVSKITESYINL